MSEKRLIGISLIPEQMSQVDLRELPTLKGYQTEDRASYLFPRKKAIDAALREILKTADIASPITIFLAVEIFSIEERRRRRSRDGKKGGEKCLDDT